MLLHLDAVVLLLQEAAQLVLAPRHRPVLVQHQLLQVTDLPTSKYLFWLRKQPNKSKCPFVRQSVRQLVR